MSLDGPRLKPAREPATHLVVLCHGYGSDGNDLIGLAPHWRGLLPGAAFASPNAPDRCQQAPSGYQWFPLSRIDPHETLKGAESAAPKLNAFIDAELARLHLSGDRLALVGFSQGTMMALHVALRRPDPFAGIVGFSGRLLEPARLAAEIASRPPVLLIHGDEDPMVPVAHLAEATDALAAAGVETRTHVSPGTGHGIAPDGLGLALGFIRDRLSVA
jgi:phospholipase/carboxylesterase